MLDIFIYAAIKAHKQYSLCITLKRDNSYVVLHFLPLV